MSKELVYKVLEGHKFKDLLIEEQTITHQDFMKVIDEALKPKLLQPTQFHVTGKYVTGAVCPVCGYDELGLEDKFCKECGRPIDVDYNIKQFDLILHQIENERKKDK